MARILDNTRSVVMLGAGAILVIVISLLRVAWVAIYAAAVLPWRRRRRK